MKAMSTTLVIVVTAIVILIAALVIITIFGRSIGNVATLADARSVCMTEAATTCKSIGQLPPTWHVPTKVVNDGGKTKRLSCFEVTGMTECSGTQPTCVPLGRPCSQGGLPCCEGTCSSSTGTCLLKT